MSSQRASQHDVEFLNDMVRIQCPEYNGYSTARARNQGFPIKPRTKIEYKPLIDMYPSDPDTIMTSLTKAQEITNSTGQEFVVFTCDLQLFKEAQKILWTYPDRFSNVVLRVGGMHMLMSFVGAIGSLMAGSGLAEILESAFGGVAKLLTGKKFPQNVRALRLVMEELLRDILLSNEVHSMNHLISILENLSVQSRTTKLWVDCFIKPILIIMKFVRAECEGDWSLHLHAVKQMMPQAE